MRTFLTALAMVLVSACASQPAQDRSSIPPAQPPGPTAPPAPAARPAPAPPVNLSGYSPEFKRGYTDGCASAKPNTARTRNEESYKSDANYAQGWRDGYDICQRKK